MPLKAVSALLCLPFWPFLSLCFLASVRRAHLLLVPFQPHLSQETAELSVSMEQTSEAMSQNAPFTL